MVWTSANTLLIALLAGHFLADFVAQTDGIATRKATSNLAMTMHGLATLLTHVVVALPLLTIELLIGLVVLAAVHTLTDVARREFVREDDNRELTGLLLDQAVHVISILILWHVLTGGARAATISGLLMPALSEGALRHYGQCLAVAGGLAVNWKGGTAVVKKLLLQYPEAVPGGGGQEDGNAAAAKNGDVPTEPGEIVLEVDAAFPERRELAIRVRGIVPERARTRASKYKMGAMIGCLERTLVFALVLFGQWAALGFVIAAKSIARFKELDDKHFADYYLIGTLASMLVAVGTGILVRYLLSA